MPHHVQAVPSRLDGTPGGYSWPDLVREAARQSGRSQRTLFLPPPLARLTARAAMLAARLSGGPPMLTLGKLPELYHRDWVSHAEGLDAVTGAAALSPLPKGWRQPSIGTGAKDGCLEPARRLETRSVSVNSKGAPMNDGDPAIFAKICELLQAFNKGLALEPDLEIMTGLEIDSVAVMDFVMEVEDHFDIDIPLNVLSKPRSSRTW